MEHVKFNKASDVIVNIENILEKENQYRITARAFINKGEIINLEDGTVECTNGKVAIFAVWRDVINIQVIPEYKTKELEINNRIKEFISDARKQIPLSIEIR